MIAPNQQIVYRNPETGFASYGRVIKATARIKNGIETSARYAVRMDTGEIRIFDEAEIEVTQWIAGPKLAENNP